MDDIKTINRIFQDCNLSLWGVCPFWAVKDSIISCRAKNKIPADAVSVICVLFPYLTVEEKNAIFPVMRLFRIIIWLQAEC